MTGTELLALLFGLGAAAAWGAGDFSGGLATKRSDVFVVVMIAQVAGTIPLVAAALIWGGPLPAAESLALGGTGGLFGMVGLLALYRGLSLGRMGVVAPVTSVVAALLPMLLGSYWDGLPTRGEMAGIVLALVAVWLLARAEPGQPLAFDGLGLPILAGTAFGLYFIFIDQAAVEVVLWPLVAARLTSLAMLIVYLFVGPRKRLLPPGGQLPLMILAGLLDTAGNIFFALAAQVGRLDIAAVLSSFYPGTTALLAWLVLKERLNRTQWMGIAAALAALVLMAMP
jgi:drug/metabolite transporter (DMT)-like permease